MDNKVQMLDAGTALFEMEGGFGTALGQVKAEMSEFGKVSIEDEYFILDLSDIWRKSYISCHLESAGEAEKNRYAAVLKEGSRSSLLRNITIIALLILAMAICVFVSILIGLILFAGIAYIWIIPGKKATLVSRKLIEKISELTNVS